MSSQVAVFDRLLEVALLIEQDLTDSFAGTGLTTARTHLLWVLHHAGPSNQQTLAAALSVSPRNITGLVDALEAGGYVARSPHPTDRRSIIVSLGASAHEMMRTMQQEHAQLSADLLGAVAPADREALVRGIDAIADRLRELLAADEARRAG